MTAFVDDMRSPERSLAVSTVNGRLSKVKEIYKIACGKHLLTENPAIHTLGVGQSAAARRRKKRLPFSPEDLELIFGSRIFTAQYRSPGQSGEASYWIPALMYYTGGRPEALAGLALETCAKILSTGGISTSSIARAQRIGIFLMMSRLSQSRSGRLLSLTMASPKATGAR